MAPAWAATWMAVLTASVAEALMAWLMPETWRYRVDRSMPSGRSEGRMRLAAEPARR
ncbi:hypothetical protein D3C80_2017250 [compost metagenome]